MQLDSQSEQVKASVRRERDCSGGWRIAALLHISLLLAVSMYLPTCFKYLFELPIGNVLFIAVGSFNLSIAYGAREA